MIGFSILLYCFISAIESFTPNCVPQNQFINYEFPLEACSENFGEKCKFHPKGYFKSVGEARLVKIHEVSVIPTCAFYLASGLEYIYGVNSNIEVIATKAFVNLPNLKSIHLAFNLIVEVRKDVFKNISAEMIDLSWNRITFIDSHAFKEVENLRYLNISKNSLKTLSINNLGKNLRDLNMSNNLIRVFLLNSAFFERLTHVNASNNKIDKVAISYKYRAEVVDLTGNRIENFDYLEVSAVNFFKMGYNLFKETPRYLENLNAREIEIYPNPWKCDQLFQLWQILLSFDMRLSERKNSAKPTPECSQALLTRYTTDEIRTTHCTNDFECPTFMACRARRCWNLCEESLCHSSSYCHALDHKFTCSCPSNLLSDPLDIHGECKNVSCYLDKQCPTDNFCYNGKCEENFLGSGDSSGTISGWGEQDITAPQFFDPSATDPTTPAATVPIELPWWFEEIPSIEPPRSTTKKTV